MLLWNSTRVASRCLLLRLAVFVKLWQDEIGYQNEATLFYASRRHPINPNSESGSQKLHLDSFAQPNRRIGEMPRSKKKPSETRPKVKVSLPLAPPAAGSLNQFDYVEIARMVRIPFQRALRVWRLIRVERRYVGVFIAGMVLPPIAVAMRFGFTRDFFINVVFTVRTTYYWAVEWWLTDGTIDYGLFPFSHSQCNSYFNPTTLYISLTLLPPQFVSHRVSPRNFKL